MLSNLFHCPGLLLSQVCWYLHQHGGIEVSTLISTAKDWPSLAFHAQDLAILRSSWHGELIGLVKDLDLGFSAQYHIYSIQLDDSMQASIVDIEVSAVRDLDFDNEVTV